MVKGKPVERPLRLFHDLRRTAVRDLVRAGVPRTVAESISGHKTDVMSARYRITSTDEQKQALARMTAYRQALPADPRPEPLAGTYGQHTDNHPLKASGGQRKDR